MSVRMFGRQALLALALAFPGAAAAADAPTPNPISLRLIPTPPLGPPGFAQVVRAPRWDRADPGVYRNQLRYGVTDNVDLVLGKTSKRRDLPIGPSDAGGGLTRPGGKFRIGVSVRW